MTGKQHGGRAVDRRLAGWLRPDFWAVVRMADRAAGTYLRGFVVVAALVGFLTFVGLTLSPRLGGPEFRGALALSTFAGALQVVPELGPLLGFFPALLLLAYDPQNAARLPGRLRRRALPGRFRAGRPAAGGAPRRPSGRPHPGRRHPEPGRPVGPAALSADPGLQQRPRPLPARPALGAATPRRDPPRRTAAGHGGRRRPGNRPARVPSVYRRRVAPSPPSTLPTAAAVAPAADPNAAPTR